RVLKFLSTPWVHWPDTMCTWLERDRVLFTCDLFGSHMASSELFARDEPRVLNAAKRYFAEIMMPCGKAVPKAVDKVAPLQPDIIAPSHGPVFDRPQLILDAYRRWTVAPPENLVVLPHVSMHGSTRLLVDRMTEALGARGVRVERFDLLTLDPGLLATALMDAATLVLGTPAMLHSLHPHAGNAARLINTLRPKLKYVAAVGSYGWNGKLFDELATFFPDLKVESLGTVTCKGLPRPSDIEAVDRLADLITERHRSLDSAV
ncbi:MAG TPA: FprA family A-type flavoprotein, partial [Acidobacteriota bacterium]|nr:FprA family A-type flavoprotein [Acidobacteriota bacterium]